MRRVRNGCTFIGPRILTRRQFLTELGVGAAALGLSQIPGCRDNPPPPPPPPPPPGPEDLETVVRTHAGEKGVSYLNREVTDTKMIDHLNERAASFSENCQGGEMPSDIEIVLHSDEDMPSLDAGGIATNDLRLISPVDLERSPVLMDYLSGKAGRDVTPENANCSFVTTRFFAAATSNADPLHHPVIGITDSVIASVHDVSGQDDQVATDLFLVDCEGLKNQTSETFDKNMPPPGQDVDQNQLIPGRDSLINAYFDHLVGYNGYSGEKVYVPFDPSESERFNPTYGSTEYGGTRVVEYRKIFPEAMQATTTPPPEATSPDSPNDANYDFTTAQSQGQLSDAWPVRPDIDSSGYFLAGGETYATELPWYTVYYTGTASVEKASSYPGGCRKKRRSGRLDLSRTVAL